MSRILLAHGLFGFSKIGRLSYFNGVRPCFGEGASFITPDVDPAGSVWARAGQLKDAIQASVPEQELAQGKTIHIVAHSMGGLDARYLISRHGLDCSRWIASLTTISTPHRGSPLADIVTGARRLTLGDLAGVVANASAATVASILKSLGKPLPPGVPLGLFAPAAILESLGDLKGYAANLLQTPPEAFSELTTNFITGFNTDYPDLEGVPLLCYSGKSSPDQTMCRAFFPFWLILKSIGGDNDGAVPTSSSSWGGNVRGIPADHFEEIGCASFFDGLPPLPHYPVCNLYSEIAAWQKSLP
jgi:triacylglycerol lipase